MVNRDIYKNKYRIPSARLPRWNYSDTGYYYVTICTKGKVCWFGNVVDRKMELSDLGHIVNDEWLRTKQIRTNIDLDEYRVMPNHIHMIITIKKNINLNVETSRRDVSTIKNRKYLKSNSLGSIINQFKSICTKHIWKLGYKHFSWQSRYYDHIIRTEYSLNKIREYIRFNPNKWDIDEENPNHI